MKYNFEELFGDPLSVRQPRRVTRVDVHVDAESVAGRIGSRTSANKYYRGHHMEKDVYTLKDKKFRSLSLPARHFRMTGAGRNGTYTEQFAYKPRVPVKTLRRAYVKQEVSAKANDVMMLLDAEHALNAARVDNLSHGGVREIAPDDGFDPAVTDVAAQDGADFNEFDRMRGMSYQFNYSDPANMALVAKQNFMLALSGHSTTPVNRRLQ